MGGKRITVFLIKQSFENEGYKLLTTEYKNNSTILSYKCSNGHKLHTSWSNWQQNNGRCWLCLRYKKIKQSFENEGYKLLTTEYKKANEYLYFICPNGHKHKIIWSSWKQGNRCGKCHYNTYEQIKYLFEKEGYKLLSENYINNITPLNYICPNGHKHKIIWKDWISGNRCPYCSMHGISKPEKEIFNYIRKIYNGKIIENDRSFIKNPKTGQYLELDIWLPDIRKAIEYNSKWYHKEDNIKYRDYIKRRYCRKNGINLMIINHDEWIKNKNFKMIENFVKNKVILKRINI